MKRNLLIVLMIVFAINLSAQRSVPPGGDHRIEKMKKELSLSDEQYSRLKKVQEDFENNQTRLRADTSLTREKKIAGRKVIMEERSTAIKDILTKEQYDKWMAMKPDNRSRETSRTGDRADAMKEMKKELALSDEQVKKIGMLNAEMTARFQKVRADTAMARAERPKAVRGVVLERNEKISKILTEEQFKKFLAYEKANAHMRRRGAKQSPRR